MYLVIPFVLDAIITFILSRMKVEEANDKIRAEMKNWYSLFSFSKRASASAGGSPFSVEALGEMLFPDTEFCTRVCKILVGYTCIRPRKKSLRKTP